jgi:hypothetical protein
MMEGLRGDGFSDYRHWTRFAVQICKHPVPNPYCGPHAGVWMGFGWLTEAEKLAAKTALTVYRLTVGVRQRP